MTNILSSFNLSNRVAIVPGGPGRLGKEFCRTLAEAGASVVVADINAEGVNAVTRTLIENGYHALGVATDVTQPESVQALFQETLYTFSRLDILRREDDSRFEKVSGYLNSAPQPAQPPGGFPQGAPCASRGISAAIPRQSG